MSFPHYFEPWKRAPWPRAQFGKYDAERRRIEAAQPTSDFDKAVEHTKKLAGSPAARRGRKRNG